MKKMTIEEFVKHAQSAMEKPQDEHIMVLRGKRPAAVLLGIEHKDEEDWRLEVSPEFWKEIEEARRQPTVSWDDVKAELLEGTDVLRFKGTIAWLEDGERYVHADILRGILRFDDELVLNCNYDGWDYDVVLRRNDGSHFEGEFAGQKGNKSSPVKASGVLYSNDQGCLITGQWLEDGYDVKWWAELEPVESFADEKQEVRA